MDQTELEKGTLEREALDADSRKVVELLSALPRVEAPGNFEFRVKAGIAAGEPKSHSSFSPFLKAAVALPLILVVGTFAIFYETGTPVTDVAGGREASVEKQPEPASPGTVSAATPPAENLDRAEPADVVAIAERQSRRPAQPRTSTPGRQALEVSSNSSVGGGSRVETVINPKVIDPPGFNSNLGRQEKNSNSTESPDNVSVREMLEMLGVKAEYVDGGWTVRSTTENSVANRSGVRANDVIESVNNETIAGKSFLKGRLEGKTIKVRRDGKQIEIGLQD